MHTAMIIRTDAHACSCRRIITLRFHVHAGVLRGDSSPMSTHVIMSNIVGK